MERHPVTLALERVERGEPGAGEELWGLVYEDLRSLASARIAKLGPGQTLQATALVNEVWMRLGSDAPQGFKGSAHFFGAAARAMRNIVVDQARRKGRLRRNSAEGCVTLTSDLAVAADGSPVDMLALDEALTALAEQYERPARVILLRFFAGLEIPRIAALLGLSARTVDRELLFARTWLRRFMGAA